MPLRWVFLALLLGCPCASAADSKLAEFLKGKEKKVLDECVGDTRYSPPRCQHLGYRNCMRFLNNDGTPYIFGTYDPTIDKMDNTSGKMIHDPNKDGLDWWEWSTQPEHKDAWIAGMKKEGGDYWCACALCTSEAVDRFGCDKLDIKCDATDIAFLRKRVEVDGHTVLQSNLDCLYKKCGKDAQKGWPIVGADCGGKGCARLYDEDHSHAPMIMRSGTAYIIACAVVAGISMGLVASVTLYRRSPLSAKEAYLRIEPVE